MDVVDVTGLSKAVDRRHEKSAILMKEAVAPLGIDAMILGLPRN